MTETTSINTTDNPEVFFGNLQKNWRWLLWLGIVFVILGGAGLGMTYFLTMASVLYFGFLLLIGGGAQLVHAFTAKGWKDIVFSILIAVLYVIAGIAVINNPMAASEMLTILLAATLIGIGLTRIIIAFRIRRVERKNWVWLLFSGVISAALGLIIIAHWPVSGLMVIGLIIAVEMILNGWSLISVALVARQASKESSATA